MAKEKGEKKLAGVRFVTPVFRLSFPHLFVPHKAPKADKAKYSVTMLFPKDADRKAMNQALMKAGVEAWGPDRKKWPKVELPWRDGDQNQDYSGYEGQIYAQADSLTPPGVVNRQKQKVINQAEIYAGCYCIAEVTAKAVLDVAGKHYLKFYLGHVMKWKDGEAFDGRSSVEDAFGDVADDEVSEDLSEDYEETIGDEGF